MSTITTEQAIPTGTWTLDKVHSSVGYAVRHSGVSLFKGGLDRLRRRRSPTARSAAAPTSPSITVNDENLAGPPALAGLLRRRAQSRASRSSRPSIRRDGDELIVEGELEIRGVQAARHADRHDRRPGRRPCRREDRPHARDRDRPDDASGSTGTWSSRAAASILDNEVTLTADLELAKAQA